MISLYLLIAPAIAAEPSSDWDRFQFVGNQTFSDDQLLNALVAESDFLLATHPHGALVGLCDTTQRLLLAGYRRAGFHSPTVQIETLEKGGAVIHIDEGKRFTCGQIQVNGAKQIDVPLLAQRLTEPFAKRGTFPTFIETGGKLSTRWTDSDGKSVSLQSPVWDRHQPAPFETERQLSLAVQETFKDLGFSAAIIQVSIKTLPATLTADLIIDILEEGEPDRVETFAVVGSQANTPEQVLAYLELQPGIVFDSLQQQRLTQKLWEGGRFTKHHIQFDRDAAGTGRLRIELADVPGVPPLTQPLSEEANVFLRARKWLSAADDREEDLRFTLHAGSSSLDIVHSRQGLMLQMSRVRENVPHQTTFLVDANCVGFVHSASPDFWLADVSDFRGSIRMETKLGAAQSDNAFANINLNLSCHSKRSAGESLLSQALNLSPADWCAFAYKQNIRVETVGNQLIATGDTETLEMETESGRIIHWESQRSKASFEAGLFQRMRETFMQQCAGKQNLYESSQPITSLVKLGTTEAWWNAWAEFGPAVGDQQTGFDPSLRSAFEKLTSAGLLRPADAFAIHLREYSAAERFVIPGEVEFTGSLVRWAIELAGKYTLKCLPQLFAEGTWPIAVAREACLVSLQRGKHTGQVLQELHLDSSAGPLRDASVAYLLSLVNHPLASRFATRSLNNMEPGKFDRDVKIMLSGPCGRWLTGIITEIASLNLEEVEALARLSKSDHVKAAFIALQTGAGATSPEQTLWYQVTHKSLANMLQSLIDR